MKQKTLLHYFLILVLSIGIILLGSIAFTKNAPSPDSLSIISQANAQGNTAPASGACSVPLLIPPPDFSPADDWKDDKPLCIDPDERSEILNCDKNTGPGINYFNYWYCHPRKITQSDDSCVESRMSQDGLDRDRAIHVCDQDKVRAACRGWKTAQNSNYLVHFWSRIDYLTGYQTRSDPEITGLLRGFITKYGEDLGRRITWNYIMTEVKSGWTTFGMVDYQVDINFASMHVFQKPWAEVFSSEQARGCGNAWAIACRPNGPTDVHPEQTTCQPGYACSSNAEEIPVDSDPSYLCKNPSGDSYQLPGVVSFQTVFPPPYQATECRVRLAIPPKDFALEINPDPAARMTKENYFKRWDLTAKQYSTDDLPRPPPGEESESGNNCYINNHPINIDDAKCGTSWYYSWAQCEPGGSWRPVVPHGVLPAGTSHGGATACEGSVRAWNSPFLVNFRNLVNYNYNSYGAHQERLGKQWARSLWNFIMSEVRTGNTTFGQMYSWESDMDYMSQKVFGKSWNEAFNEELRRDCPMDTWEFLCREEESMDEALYPVVCGNSEACSSHWDEDRSEENPATFTCSGYEGDTPNPGPRGYLEEASCSTLRGWACDVSKRGQTRNVYIFDGPATGGKAPAGQIVTSISRSDLKTQCDIERSGPFGFSLSLPSSLRDGKSHTIYAYTGDSPTDNLVPLQFIGNGAPTITCQ